MSNQARDAAMFQMMIRTGMVRLWQDDKEVCVEICSNWGSSGGLFKSAIPGDSAIPRATVAEALAASLVEYDRRSQPDDEISVEWGAAFSLARVELSATIAKLGLGVMV